MLPVNARCVKSHRSCSTHHAELVTGYREERLRQEIALENEWHKEQETTKLITFKEWLIGNRRCT